MSAERKFTPVSEVESDLVTLQLNLPAFINPNSIGLNVGRTESLMKYSGLVDLNVTGVGGQETSSEYPTVIGYSKQGEAYAGSVGVKVNVPEQRMSSRIRDTLDSSTKKVDMTLNLDEMSEQIKREKWDRGIYSTEAWSKHLNSAIKTGIKSEGTRNLLLLDEKGSLLLSGMLNYLTLQFSLIDVVQNNLNALNFQALTAMTLKAAWYFYSDRENYRISPFFGTHFERVAVLGARLSMGKLVKALPKAE